MENIISFSPIFKIDSKGKTRIWSVCLGYDDSDIAAYQIISGIKDGNLVTSEWKYTQGKNLGKKNEKNALEQAKFEINSLYAKQKGKGYSESVEESLKFDKVKPMLATDFKKVSLDFQKNNYFSQPKLDGIRCIARKDGLWSRAGKQITSVPHIQESLKVFFEKYPDAILDGELYNHDLKEDFNKITSLVRKTKLTKENLQESANIIQYHVYDMVTMPNKNALFEERLNWFDNQGFSNEVQCVKTKRISNKEKMDAIYQEYLEQGYEGQMIRVNYYYENKRSKNLVKRKEFITEEYGVLNIEEGVGNWSGAIKRFIIKLPDGRTFGAGVRGAYKDLKDLLESSTIPDWATIRYFSLTPDGIPRFPVVIDYGFGKRDD
jgi:DNA ligase-1